MARDTIPHRLLQQAQARPTAIAYHAKRDGQWQPTTWRAFVDEVRLAAFMTDFDRFLLFGVVPFIALVTVLEGWWLSRRRSYDWGATGMSVLDLIVRLVSRGWR